ncbi:MAG TPA: DUF1707 domain-containing protein [Actinophytocola sp.]|jgi:hypothetical protein|uniref:DUF1707 SHOCT-like domain-containing protein n=1 Tax=Actinophytocola sp. TaxID=1872138 RepID=UPI002F946B26
MAKASDADVRISNAERDEAVETLGVHLSTGRLELAEFEERSGRAAAARTRGELEALFTDLPAPHPDLSSATPPAPLIQKAGQLVTDPAGKRKSKELVETPASKGLEAVAGLAFVFGIPGAILLTIFAGAWWVFIPVAFVIMVAGGAADAAKKKATPGAS